MDRCKKISAAVFAVYILVLFSSFTFKFDFSGEYVKYCRLLYPEISFKFIPDFQIHIQDLTPKQILMWVLETVGNLVAFMPVGFFVSEWRASRRKLKRFASAALVGLAVSLSIELTQTLAGIGIGDSKDLIVNTAGAILGAAVGLIPEKRAWKLYSIFMPMLSLLLVGTVIIYMKVWHGGNVLYLWRILC